VTPSIDPAKAPRLAYLALETPVPGQAAHTHIHEIILGLQANGWAVERFFATRSGASAGRSFAIRLADYVGVQRRLVRALPHVDVVFVRGHFMAFAAALWARAAGKVVVHEINGATEDVVVTYPWMRPFRAVMRHLQRWQLRAADAIFAVTPGLAEWARLEAGHDRVHLVPNGANVNLFTPEGPRHQVRGTYVVFVGGLVRWHGVGTMLAALRDEAWPPGVDLVIVGDGVERDRLVAAEGAEPRLCWLRRQDYAKVPDILRGALAALVPIEDPRGRSSRGVLPLKMYEAMACGVPVVATDLPGQSELVRDEGAGLVVPVGDPGALAGAVAALANDPGAARRMGAAGARAVRARHSWQHRADAIHSVLVGCLSQRSSA
jgi:glycosyltransferase involved in cell wall biosynthesis